MPFVLDLVTIRILLQTEHTWDKPKMTLISEILIPHGSVINFVHSLSDSVLANEEVPRSP